MHGNTKIKLMNKTTLLNPF